MNFIECIYMIIVNKEKNYVLYDLKSGIKLEDNNICFPKKFHFWNIIG